MRLRHIVPTLGLVVAAGSAQAVEVGALQIGGFVDSIFNITTNPGFDGDADADVGFNSMAELQVGASVTDAVQLQVDLEYYDNGSTNLEQAYVAYAVNDMITLQMGRWEGLIGYEGWDAPSLYRINQSIVFANNGNLVDGLDVNIKANEQMTVDLYIANNGIVVTPGYTKTDALSVGADLAYGTEDYNIDLDLVYDMAVEGALDDEKDVVAINLNGDYTSGPLTAFGDLAFRLHDVDGMDDEMGLMLGVNYGINETMSVTGMVAYWDGPSPGDDEQTELALALLTTPTGDSNFAINYEVEMKDNAAADDAEVGVFLEMLALIP